jgi:hypothetical protein
MSYNYVEEIMKAPHGRDYRDEPLGPPPEERKAGERSAARAAEIKYWASTDLNTQDPLMVFKLLMMLREAAQDYDWAPKPQDPDQIAVQVRCKAAAELMEIVKRHKNPGVQAGLMAAAEHLDPSLAFGAGDDEEDDQKG